MKLLNDFVLVGQQETSEEVSNSGIILGETELVHNVLTVKAIAENIDNPPYKVGDTVLLSHTGGTEHAEGMVIPKAWIVAIIE